MKTLRRLYKIIKSKTLLRLLEDKVKENLDSSKLVHRECPLCSGDNGRPITHPLRPLDFVKCRRCRLVYLRKVTSPEALVELRLALQYKGIDHAVPHMGFKSDEAALQSKVKRFNQLKDIAGIEKGRLLDVGTSYGYLVKAALDQGWEATGIEFDNTRVEEARRRFGLELVQTKVEDFESSEKFDLIILEEVLEHIIDPVALLSHCKRLLRDERSRIFVSVPNYESLSRKIFNGLQRTWSPVHVQFFTARTVQRAAKAAGLSVKNLWSESISMRDILENPLKLTIVDNYNLYDEIKEPGFQDMKSRGNGFIDRGVVYLLLELLIAARKVIKYPGDNLCILMSKQNLSNEKNSHTKR